MCTVISIVCHFVEVIIFSKKKLKLILRHNRHLCVYLASFPGFPLRTSGVCIMLVRVNHLSSGESLGTRLAFTFTDFQLVISQLECDTYIHTYIHTHTVLNQFVLKLDNRHDRSKKPGQTSTVKRERVAGHSSTSLPPPGLSSWMIDPNYKLPMSAATVCMDPMEGNNSAGKKY